MGWRGALADVGSPLSTCGSEGCPRPRREGPAWEVLGRGLEVALITSTRIPLAPSFGHT